MKGQLCPSKKIANYTILQERIIKSYSKVTHGPTIAHRRKSQLKRNLILHPQDIKAKGFDQ